MGQGTNSTPLYLKQQRNKLNLEASGNDNTEVTTIGGSPNVGQSHFKDASSKLTIGIKSVTARNKIAPKEFAKKPNNFKKTNCLDRFLDAIYFICPECSIIQCSAIAIGLLTSALLTILFLHLGGYWNDRTITDTSTTIVSSTRNH